MTIGTLSARIMMDASGVRSGLGLTRAEMKLTRQAFIDSTSDVQKLETALGTLATARDKGAFADEAAYAAAIAAVRAELDPTVQAQQAVAAAVAQTSAALQDQIATAGMSAEAVQRYRLQQQGATVDQLASVQALQQQAAAAQQQAQAAAQLEADTGRLQASLREEIATRGMSADQVALWKLQQQGASQATIAGVAALQQEAEALREQDAAAAAAAAETSRLENEVEQVAQALRTQAATAGMSAEAIQSYRLQQQGATADQLASIQTLQQQAAAAQQQAQAAAQLEADTGRLQASLREEIATRGMSADQVALWKLEQQGATQATIAGVAALQRDAQALRQQDAATAAAAAETNRLETEVEQVAQALRTEAATAGMSADQLQLYKLRTQGATAATIQQIAALQRQRTAAQQAVGGQRDLASGLQQVAQGAGGTIPGVSGLTNTLQLGHPVLIAAAVAVAGVAIAYKTARAAIDWYVDGVGEALDSIDQLSKEARTLGTSVQDLREVRFAMAEIAGINTSSSDRQMERLSKAIADANAGAAEQSDAFRRLHLDSRALADTGATETIQAIAGAMDQIPSRTERIRIAQQLFGKDSADLVNFLIAGQQAIDASTAAARRYGGVISELDAAQVEATNDAWGRVSVALAGLTEQAAVQLAPALQVAAEKVLELLDPGTSSGQTLRMALEPIPPLLSKMIDLGDIFIGNFQAAQAAAMGLGNVIVQAAAMADQAIAAITPGREANADLQAWAADYSRQVELAATDAAKRIASGFTGGTERSIASAAAKAKQDAAAAEAAKAGDAATAGMLDALAAAAQQQLAGATAETTGAIRTQTAAIGEWDDALTNAAAATAGITFTNPLTDLAAGPQGMGLLDEFDAFRAANDQLAGSMGQVRDRLAEQIEYWGMDADAVELAKLAKQGATQQELDELRTLQGRLRELEAQKKSANAAAAGAKTSGTIEARSAYSPEVWDSLRARNEPSPYADRYAGIGAPVPADQSLPAIADVPQLATDVTAGWQPLPAPPVAPPIPAEIESTWADILGGPDVQPIDTTIAAGWNPLPAAPAVQPIDTTIAAGWDAMPAAPDVPPISAEIQSTWADILGGPNVPPIDTTITAGRMPAVPVDPWNSKADQTQPGDGKDPQLPWLEKIARGIEALVAKEGLVVEEV